MNPAFLPDGVLDHLRAVADLPDLAGTRYELESEVGRGGMGVVYAAHDRVLGRRVALKVLGPGARPLEEARIVAQLEHPGIVPVHDAGTLADGRAWYAMKLVDGKRLDAWLGAAPLPARLRVFQKVCDAVAFAHSRGVPHRDLKPANIMVGSFGEVLVLDWGAPGIAGTPGFMAPESGRDARSDVYSLGALLNHMLPGPAPRPLAAIAAKAMAASPQARYPTVVDLSAEVARWLDGLAVEAYRESPWERAVRFAARNRFLLVLLAAYVLVRLLLLFFRRL